MISKIKEYNKLKAELEERYGSFDEIYVITKEELLEHNLEVDEEHKGVYIQDTSACMESTPYVKMVVSDES